ncbi:MAG: hypothetical protein IPJ74_26705 [Saprospiraceae bacterium]|nr:hypothetical protein [Saprospiraceae bacterium]
MVSLNNLLYDEWIDNNQRIVDEKRQETRRLCAYAEYGRRRIEWFLIDMTSEAYQRRLDPGFAF